MLGVHGKSHKLLYAHWISCFGQWKCRWTPESNGGDQTLFWTFDRLRCKQQQRKESFSHISISEAIKRELFMCKVSIDEWSIVKCENTCRLLPSTSTAIMLNRSECFEERFWKVRIVIKSGKHNEHSCTHCIAFAFIHIFLITMAFQKNQQRQIAI